MDIQPQIKYRADGSIDTAYYIQKAHHARSMQAHRLLAQKTPRPVRPKTRLLWFFRKAYA